MGIRGANTGIKITTSNGYVQDLGETYVSNDYLLDVYPNLVSGRTSSGLWIWGNNTFGQCGQGAASSAPNNTYSSPIQVGSLTNWKMIGMGRYHISAIKKDGTLWSWGNNSSGQLGNGSTTQVPSPIQIGADTNWSYITTGDGSGSFAIKTDGTLWGWGFNTYGQLCTGNTTNYSSPIQIGSLMNWKFISNPFAPLAIKTDGTLWSWGINVAGQLGLGNTTYYSSPVQVGSLTNWKQVSSSGSCAFAIKTDGTLWAWGQNDVGQLGLGNRTYYSSPVQVGSLTNWRKVFASDEGGAAIKTDGTLWAWGQNEYGQVGDGTIISRSSPVQIGSLTNWKNVALKVWSTFALKTDGTLWAWGDNFSQADGILGIGSATQNYSSPIQVGSLTNWKMYSDGGVGGNPAFILDGQI